MGGLITNRRIMECFGNIQLAKTEERSCTLLAYTVCDWVAQAE